MCSAAWRAEEASVALSEAERVATMKGSPSSAVVVGRRLLRPTQWFMWARRNTSEAAPFFLHASIDHGAILANSRRHAEPLSGLWPFGLDGAVSPHARRPVPLLWVPAPIRLH